MADLNTNSGQKHRQYGAELLRIVCMLMILTSHFFVHGKVLGTLKPTDVNFHITWFIEACCYVMVNCFVLITGYYQSAGRFRLHKLLLLWGQIIATSSVIYAALAVLGKVEFSLSGFIAACTPVTHSRYWFATAYVILYAVSPLLNSALSRTTLRQHFTAVCALFGVFVLLRNIFYPLDFENLHGGYSYTSFIVLYVIGAYMRRAETRIRHPLAKYFALSAVTALSRILLTVCYYKLSLPSVYLKMFMQYNSVTVVLASVCLFDFFVHLEVRAGLLQTAARVLAPFTFGVYLIHEQAELKPLIWEAVSPSSYARSPSLYLHLAATVILLFLSCSLLDGIRHGVSNLVGIPKLAKKLSDTLTAWTGGITDLLYKRSTGKSDDR